jgi:hypothetical protein
MQVGPPHEVVSHDDHIWRRRRGHTHLLDKDNWDFVNADTDQGFFFHMLRVRNKLGGDLRLTECAEDEPGAKRSWPKRAPPSSPETFWFHYGAMGGEKPDGVLRRWHWVQSQRVCARVESINYFADGSEVLLRSLLWARRAVAEVDYLQRFNWTSVLLLWQRALAASPKTTRAPSTSEAGPREYVDATQPGRRLAAPRWLK